MWNVNVLSGFINPLFTAELYCASKQVLHNPQHKKPEKCIPQEPWSWNIWRSRYWMERQCRWENFNDRLLLEAWTIKVGALQVGKSKNNHLCHCLHENPNAIHWIQLLKKRCLYECWGSSPKMGYERHKPTLIGRENQNYLKTAANPVLSKRSKLIDKKYIFARETVEDWRFTLI